MVHSHHSHSSSYCCHASSPLEEMVETAISKNFKVFCLTEHVPRLEPDFIYPEESHLSINDLKEQFEAFIEHARHIQNQVNNDPTNVTRILVGFEAEGGINEDHLKMCLQYRDQYNVDLVVGSVHHVKGIPIDFDFEQWKVALDVVGKGSLETLYYEYFQAVFKMIQVLKPEVVAHFDLIRLFTPEENSICDLRNWPRVWEIIEKCVALIVELDLLVELNSSAIRKGWTTPYPQPDVFKYMLEKNVKFCLSDDSHNKSQIGLNYHKVIAYLKEYNVSALWYYSDVNDTITKREISVDQLEKEIVDF